MNRDDPFQVKEVSSWPAEDDEEMGARDKIWVSEPDGRDLATHLWKQARDPAEVPEYGTDSCAEVLAFAVASRINVFAVEVTLAERFGARGILGRRIEGELRHGNELLSEIHRDYEIDRKGPVVGYDLASILDALSDYAGWENGHRAFDSFTGMLVFDALIGNTDRHHENWAVIENNRVLAPSFDHGASFGFNARAVDFTAVNRFVDRGRARHFAGFDSLIALARASLDLVSEPIKQLWTERIAHLSTDMIRENIEALPNGWMSSARRTFILELLIENKRRLLQ